MDGIGMFEVIVAATSFVILYIVIIEILIKCEDLHARPRATGSSERQRGPLTPHLP